MRLREYFYLTIIAVVLVACSEQPTPSQPELALEASANQVRADQERPGFRPLSRDVTDRYIVILNEETEDAFARSDELMAGRNGLRYRVWDRGARGFAVAGISQSDVEELRNHPAVRLVEEDRPLPLPSTQDLSSFPSGTWGLDRVDQKSATLDDEYTYEYTGDGEHIYFVDSGIYEHHDEFDGRLGNGVSRISWSWGADPYNDPYGHGTAVASVGAGETYGIAKEATIHSVRVADDSTSYCSDVADGLEWIADNAVSPSVASLSVKTDCGMAYLKMVDVVAEGITVVKAAGNNDTDACNDDAGNQFPYAVVAGAADSGFDRASFSNYGSCVDLFAPGASVIAAGTASMSDSTIVWGTSFAAPYISGVAAAILESGDASTPVDVKALLEASTIDGLGDLSGSPDRFLQSHFMTTDIDGDMSVESLASSFIETWTSSVTGGGSWSYEWYASVNGGGWSLVSTSSSYQRSIAAQADYDLDLRLEATSYGETVMDTLAISVEPATPVSATISGEDHVLPNQSCTYQAVVSDGAGTKSYEWKRDGNVVSTQDFYVASTGTGSFYVELMVTDDTGYDVDLMVVEVGALGVSCL